MKTDRAWIARALAAAGYEGPEPSGGTVDGVTIDTRAGCEGALFVALPGSEADGHDFVADAAARGAAAVLVSLDRANGIDAGEATVFAVPDPLAGLQALAAAWRNEVDPVTVGITGTNGKTNTKELVAAVLRTRHRVHATPGNLNNHIGLPLTLLGMESGAEVLVAEMGASHAGEIRALAAIACPSTGVVTNIGPGHLAFFETLDGVAAAKAELLEALPADGTAVIPADDEFRLFLAGRSPAPVLSFGFAADADVRVEAAERTGSGYRCLIGGTAVEIPRFGRHHLLNAAAALAVGRVLGVDGEAAARALADAPPPPGRGGISRIGGVTIVDETYNANPASLRAAVEAFMELPVEGKRWLVLGDMLELGGESAVLHAESGVFCGKAGVDGLVTIGSETIEISRAAALQRKAPPAISHFLDPVSLAAYLAERTGPGDALLVKGSRGSRMELVIEALRRLAGGGTEEA
ncbi:MAG: UDP-N-acetylmuramoyl-tripeptide--D-alanyl-D-alanine ligase [Candidatus Krumholzibacteriota bacterium]|nr:UDP-N-acetylmuramoyl-tripeptide--D-alanyl-D-alanine ligase [Candidatus Krumholzibacteriota bacterium]